MTKKKTKEKFHLKKFLRIFIPFLVIVIYLWTSYVYIYYKIGSTALPATDTTYSFAINPSQSENNLIYAALGDSLTAGVGVMTYAQSYPYVLAEKIATRYDNVTFKDFSYPGAKTSNIIDDLLTPAIASQPDVVTVLIGINDIHGRVSPETFNDNYRYILERLQSETTAKIYLISIPYLGSHSLLLPPFNYYFHFRVNQYNKIIKSLAHTYNLNYIDITSPTAQISKFNAYYSSDLFHPTAKIYKLWANIIYDNLGQ